VQSTNPVGTRCKTAQDPEPETVLEFVELADWKDALTTDIRARARDASACGLTKKYSVREDGAEVGYLALDWWPVEHCSDLVLYEMFVPESLRHRGIGSQILELTAQLARSRGYSRALVIAKPFEGYPQEKLVDWYQKNGFAAVPHPSGHALAKNAS
jgi:GNAT superfamily N-acetyltransferase